MRKESQPVWQAIRAEWWQLKRRCLGPFPYRVPEDLSVPRRVVATPCVEKDSAP